MKAATKPNQIRQPYRLLKTGKASKLSGPNAGRITYLLLADQNDIYITVTHNEKRLSDVAVIVAVSTTGRRRQINHVGLNRLTRRSR